MADRVPLSLKEYLSQSDRKVRILIVSDVSKGNTLLRMHEKETGTMVQNVSCQNLNWVVNQIYIYEQAGKDFKEEYELIDDQTALMIFRNVLLKKIGTLKYYKGKDDQMSIATSKEVFNKVCLMRGNECELDDANDRMADLKTIIDAYENELKSCKKHDRIARAKYVLEYLRSSGTVDKNIFGADAELSYLKEDAELNNSIQNELLDRLATNEIYYFEEEFVEEKDGTNNVLTKLSASKDNIKFFKGLGSYNEASFIAYDIINNGYNYGDTLVLYNSAAQLPAIRTALMGNGIPMRVVSNYPATENDVISLARNIIAWAKDNFSEKALERIFGSSIIYVPGMVEIKDAKDAKDAKDSSDSEDDINEDNTDTDNLSEDDVKKLKKRNLLSGKYYYKYVLKARKRDYTLGWGFDRNKELIKRERKFTAEHKDDENAWKIITAPEIMDMHEAMLNIFDEIANGKTLSSSVFFARLYAFVSDYSRSNFIKNEKTGKYKKVNNSRDIGISLFKDLCRALAFDTRELDPDELLEYADEALSSLKLSDSASSGAVTVHAMNDWLPLDRANVYIIGLSLNEMQISDNQSPVIRDDEMTTYLSGKKCYIPTIDNQIESKKLAFYRTLSTYKEGALSFGYSYWDAEKKAEMNPSFYFTGALEMIKKDPNQVIFFEYGNPREKKTTNKGMLHHKPDALIDLFKEKGYSSSAIETLLKCPKQFAYQRVLYIPDNSYNEENPIKWLSPLTKGDFFHYILEFYSDSKNKMSANTEELTEAEKDSIRKLVETEILPRIDDKVATADPDVRTDEINSLLDDEVYPYINDLRKDMKVNGWKILEPEMEFTDMDLKLMTYSKPPKEVTIHVNSGYLDCVDYRLDEANKKVELRIRDYKTGSFSKKNQAFKEGELIQYYTYSKSLKENLLEHAKEKVSEFEGEKTKDWTFEVVGFSYDFPSDRKMTKENNVTGELQKIQIGSNHFADGLNLIRLRGILTAISETYTYPDVLELFQYINRITPKPTKEELEAQEAAKEAKKDAKKKKKIEDAEETPKAEPPKTAEDIRKEELRSLQGALDKFQIAVDGVLGNDKYQGPCKYCAYKDICINRKAGLIKDAK